MARRPRTITLRRVLAPTVALIALAACASSSSAVKSTAGDSVAHQSAAPAVGKGLIVGLISGDAGFVNSAITGRVSQVVSRSDAKWLRESFDWSAIEPARGVFTFSHYDALMLVEARMHTHVLALLSSTPRWSGPTDVSIPKNPAAYAAFVAAVVHRYGPHGTFWASYPSLRAYAITTYDLWSEPYYPNGNNGAYDPGRYARLVKAATTAGRAADPAAKFLMGAEMQGELVGSSWVWWVDALYRAVPDLNKYFDGVSVHPYGHDITGLDLAKPDAPYYGYQQMRRIELIRSQFVAHGASSKPFWATEVGWPTCVTGTPRCVSLQGQAASLRALLHYSQTTWKSWMRAVFIYYYNDQPGPVSDSDNDYGLVYSNGRPKPSLNVFVAGASHASVNTWPTTPAGP